MQILEVKCGFEQCGDDIHGRAALVIPQVETEGDQPEGIVMHTRCFEDFLHELMKQETTTMFTVALGNITDIYDGVEVRGDEEGS